MQYELIDLAHRRRLATEQLRTAETQHYNEILRRIANPNEREVQSQTTDNIAKLEAGIAALRDELRRLDAESPAPLIEPTREPGEPPAPAHIVSAVEGAVSQPETDTPKP